MTSRADLSPTARLAYDQAKRGIKEFEQAKAAVKPYTGELNESEFEDADDVYAYAFERLGLPKEDYEDVDGSAYPLIFKLLTRGKSPSEVAMAGDSARGHNVSPFAQEIIARRAK